MPCPDKTKRGSTAIEYALLCAFIAAVIAGTLALTGGDLETLFNSVINAFN